MESHGSRISDLNTLSVRIANSFRETGGLSPRVVSAAPQWSTFRSNGPKWADAFGTSTPSALTAHRPRSASGGSRRTRIRVILG